MIVTTEEISQEQERLMAMSLVLGELYFSHRMIEDTLADKDKQIEASQEDVKYWRDRFDLLAMFVSDRGMKQFNKAISEQITERGGQ